MNGTLPLKIGKYTFGVSFILGNLFLFGFLFGVAIQDKKMAECFALMGFLYVYYVAGIANVIISLGLLVYGIFLTANKEKQKQSFIGIAVMMANIPLAIIYMIVGFSLLNYFNIQ
ncbi:MAG: hypothetical protein LBR52_05615 [Prevotellaceae bacterium]|jgi:LIVCS family branched-chain amino acid:cation transporter|nr:hypothetical protein [Prevotellaceae bacterium]